MNYCIFESQTAESPISGKINRDGSLTAKKAGKGLVLDILISLFVLSMSALTLFQRYMLCSLMLCNKK